jgi:hypothetical protein
MIPDQNKPSWLFRNLLLQKAMPENFVGLERLSIRPDAFFHGCANASRYKTSFLGSVLVSARTIGLLLLEACLQGRRLA